MSARTPAPSTPGPSAAWGAGTCGPTCSSRPGSRAIVQKNFRLRLAELERLLDPRRHRRLVEVSCAHGFFLELARERFDSAFGIDITEDGIRHARDVLGLDVVRADLLEHAFGERRFDVACMWDTIEHLPRPDLCVAKLARLIEPGALIAVTTGDISSLAARLAGKTWRLIHPPTHLHYFTRHSLLRLLARHGFECVYDRTCGFYRGADFVAYSLPRVLGEVVELRARLGRDPLAVAARAWADMSYR